MTKKIVIGGQMGKSEIKEELENLTSGKDVEFSIMSDLDAAMAVKNNQADFYIGACETGAGGALAMATALLGSDKTVTVASPGKLLTEDEIQTAIENGRKAFGFTINTKSTILPILAKYLPDK